MFISTNSYFPASSKYMLAGIPMLSAKPKIALNSFIQNVIDTSLLISYLSNSPLPSATCVRVVFDKPEKGK